MELVELNLNYSTTRLVTREEPIIEESPDATFKTLLFLPENEGRHSEGGLRIQGYFKRSLPDKPLLTVITAVFNGAQHLEETILSVIRQTYDNVEYIIIDGGSIDGTLDIIHKYEHAIDYWVSEKDSGVYDAWNKGITISTASWILFIGSDDYIYKETSLENFMKKIKKIDGYKNKIVFGNLISILLTGEKKISSNNWAYYKKSIARGKCFIPHPSTYHHKSLFYTYGFFDTTYKIAGDYELLTKYFKDYDAVYIDEFVTVMRKGGLSSNPKMLCKVWAENRRARISNNYSVYHPCFLIAGLYSLFVNTIIIHKILFKIFKFTLTKYKNHPEFPSW